MTRPFDLHLGDALAFMATLPDESVDALITDPPYGTTQLAWDKPVDWEAFWREAYRVCKLTAVQVLFSAQPFTTDLINSNRERFRYEIIWEKPTVTGFLDANARPLRCHENIAVFCAVGLYSANQDRITYNPQKTKSHRTGIIRRSGSADHYGRQRTTAYDYGERHPRSVLQVPLEQGTHPTQKPVPLMEWLVNTYTDPGDLILDPFAGSGTTGVAALRGGRRFMGSELSPEYHAVALKRLQAAHAQPRLLEAL